MSGSKTCTPTSGTWTTATAPPSSSNQSCCDTLTTAQAAQRLGLTPIKAEDWLPLVGWVTWHKLPSHIWMRISRDDAYQSGVIGLMNAIRLFNPEKGVSFKTYAVEKIRWNILIDAGLTRKGWEPIPSQIMQPERLSA